MAPPRAFRNLVRRVTRGPLADREPVPIMIDGVLIDTTPDGCPLRAVVREETVQEEIGKRMDWVTKTVVTYAIADLPRVPKRGDHVFLDGVEMAVAHAFDYRAGNVDCYLGATKNG